MVAASLAPPGAPAQRGFAHAPIPYSNMAYGLSPPGGGLWWMQRKPRAARAPPARRVTRLRAAAQGTWAACRCRCRWAPRRAGRTPTRRRAPAGAQYPCLCRTATPARTTSPTSRPSRLSEPNTVSRLHALINRTLDCEVKEETKINEDRTRRGWLAWMRQPSAPQTTEGSRRLDFTLHFILHRQGIPLTLPRSALD